MLCPCASVPLDLPDSFRVSIVSGVHRRHNRYSRWIRVMVLSAGLPRRHPWGHMEVSFAALENDFLWTHCGGAHDSVTHPVAEGRNGTPRVGHTPLPGVIIPIPRAQAPYPECIWTFVSLLSTFGGVAFWLKHMILSHHVAPLTA